ncbi:hypothetical protein HYV81_02085 [Candidatus Woesearchaeota archaeon]|nr:hypothetical protein [Candidatus Woesearchaeota archaeon]
MKRLNKSGIELSINFLVVVILGLALLTMGIAMFSKFFRGAEAIKDKYNAETEAQLESLLSSGEKVAIPFTKRNVIAGETAVFGVGILNIIGKEELFVVDVKCDEFIPKGSQLPESCGSFDQNIIYVTDYKLKNNQQQKLPIAVSTKKADKEGTYILNVCVCTGRCVCNGPPYPGNMYQNLHKLYLTVI